MKGYSKFKPGQLVTINHTVYRIRKTKSTVSTPCPKCAFFDAPLHEQIICIDCFENLGLCKYFEKVCGKQDN